MFPIASVSRVSLAVACVVGLALVGAAVASPHADAGSDQRVTAGPDAVVVLDGGASASALGEVLRFDWFLLERPVGSRATLQDDEMPSARFVADMAGRYRARLIVADGAGEAHATVVVEADCPAAQPLGGIFQEPVVLAPTVLNCVDYRVTGDVQFRDHATVEAGTWIEVEGRRSLRVTESGTLRAAGTPDKPIVIVGSEAEPGHWRSLAITSADPRNLLRHVTLAHGGERGSNSNHIDTMLFVPSGARVRVMDSDIRDSLGYGLVADRGADLTGFARNRFAGYGIAPLRVDVLGLGAVDAATRFFDPEVDPLERRFVELTGSPVDANRTWQALDVPLRIANAVNVTDGAVLTIAAGAILEFASRAGLIVSCRGTGGQAISAVGSTSAPIVLRGVEHVAGSWGGLHICGSGANRLVHVVIEDAGEGRLLSGRADAAVTLASEARLEFRDSVIRRSAGWGVHAHATAILDPDDPVHASANNRFEDNALGDFERP